MELKANSSLQGGRYIIEKVLGQGGFGITYLAKQINLGRKVAIKEFFMKNDCCRQYNGNNVTVPSIGNRDVIFRYKKKFLKEAENISKLDHPNIIKVYDLFEENDTVYYVMEYIKGGSLGDYLKCYGTLSEIEALYYVQKIANALKYIHNKNINHLDIKPDNILRRDNTDIVLIDFGLSKCYDESGEQLTSGLASGRSKGYAPSEQDGGVIQFSPPTDIYSLGATLYKLLTGSTPPEASIVLNDGLPNLPGYISVKSRNAITTAMQPRRMDRPQSIDEFLTLLGKHEEDETTDPIVSSDIKAERSKRFKKGRMVAALGCLIYFVVIILFCIIISFWDTY